MRVVDLAREDPEPLPAGAVVVRGTFDGVHRSHVELLERLTATASPLVVLLLDRPDDNGLLTTVSDRLELLEGTGVELSVVVARDADDRSLLDRLAPTTIVDADNGEAAAIRRALRDGAIDEATTLLGRPFAVTGTVEHGDERARLLGFPTANVAVPPGYVLPADGIYAGTFRHAGETRVAAISLGRRPTFYEEGVRLLEAHVLEFEGDLYGRRCAVGFTRRLRPELKFDTVEALVEQMARDVAEVRAG